MSADQFRTGKDNLGQVMIPAAKYYGPETQRAVDNFKISNLHLPRSFIRAQGMIKAAAATVNIELGLLTEEMGQAIIQASEEVMQGKWDEHFVVDVYQAGAGTSQNMNANEVIAHRASEILGGSRDSKLVNPNDHVNLSQSTNDTFPSALHIAAIENLQQSLLPTLDLLYEELNQKTMKFMPILKSGRTHLHDAVPIRLGEEFSGYAQTIRGVTKPLHAAIDALYEIGLGGTAIGTGMNAHLEYAHRVMAEVSRRSKLPFREPLNIFSFMQNMNAPIQTMSVLKELAIHLIKITSDLRLLSSGPRTGLSEITLPAVQPGSTIMPGKVNPAILEMVHMVSCQVIGYDATIVAAGTSSQLEINVMMPLIAHTLLHSIEILSNAVSTLVFKCISGIQAHEVQCDTWMRASLGLVTGLSPIIGYAQAAHIGKLADEQNKTIKQVLEEKNMLTDQLLQALEPEGMV